MEQPPDESWQYLTGTHEWSVKYEIGASIGIPKIIWLSGPWKGAASDPTIAKVSGIKQSLPPGEAILADKIYQGDQIQFIVPLPGKPHTHDSDDKMYNFLVYSTRQTIERTIHRMRSFGFLQAKYRLSFEFHQKAVNVIAKLVNLFLIFEPLG
jgi:hypothetical protein